MTRMYYFVIYSLFSFIIQILCLRVIQLKNFENNEKHTIAINSIYEIILMVKNISVNLKLYEEERCHECFWNYWSDKGD